MKTVCAAICAAALLAGAVQAQPKERLVELDLLDLLRSPAIRQGLAVSLQTETPGQRVVSELLVWSEVEGIRLYFGREDLPAGGHALGEAKGEGAAGQGAAVRASRGPCDAAFTQALRALVTEGKAKGANAIVAVRSDRPGFPFTSQRSVICATPPPGDQGPARVSLRGRLVKAAL